MKEPKIEHLTFEKTDIEKISGPVMGFFKHILAVIVLLVGALCHVVGLTLSYAIMYFIEKGIYEFSPKLYNALYKIFDFLEISIAAIVVAIIIIGIYDWFNHISNNIYPSRFGLRYLIDIVWAVAVNFIHVMLMELFLGREINEIFMLPMIVAALVYIAYLTQSFLNQRSSFYLISMYTIDSNDQTHLMKPLKLRCNHGLLHKSNGEYNKKAMLKLVQLAEPYYKEFRTGAIIVSSNIYSYSENSNEEANIFELYWIVIKDIFLRIFNRKGRGLRTEGTFLFNGLEGEFFKGFSIYVDLKDRNDIQNIPLRW